MTPTHLYSALVRQLFKNGLDVHYLSNITGHGWRKIMRATVDFKYVINELIAPHEIFDFIADKSGNNIEEMYGNYNMGAGYAVYLPADQADKAVEKSKDCGLNAVVAGHLEKGSKELDIRPLGIKFAGESLAVR